MAKAPKKCDLSVRAHFERREEGLIGDIDLAVSVKFICKKHMSTQSAREPPQNPLFDTSLAGSCTMLKPIV